MTNKNCLEGIRCPECGHEDAFRIEAQITVHVTDDGTEDQGGDYAWEDESPCQCVACKHAGTIKDFRIENQNAKPDDSLRDAAPELLYALENALDVMECQNVGLGGSQALARLAITKAKGGAA